jgi:hypothetical protein
MYFEKVKKIIPLFDEVLLHEDVRGSEVIAQLLFNLALDGGEWSASHRRRFCPRERSP